MQRINKIPVAVNMPFVNKFRRMQASLQGAASASASKLDPISLRGERRPLRPH
jgi:hypothetical protein